MSPDVNFVPRQRRVSGDADDVTVKVDRGRPLITANLADAALGAADRWFPLRCRIATDDVVRFLELERVAVPLQHLIACTEWVGARQNRQDKNKLTGRQVFDSVRLTWPSRRWRPARHRRAEDGRRLRIAKTPTSSGRPSTATFSSGDRLFWCRRCSRPIKLQNTAPSSRCDKPTTETFPSAKQDDNKLQAKIQLCIHNGVTCRPSTSA